MRKKTTRLKRMGDNEVALVADMQHRLDCYERYVECLCWMIVTGKDKFLLESDISSDATGVIYKYVREKVAMDRNDKKEK